MTQSQVQFIWQNSPETWQVEWKRTKAKATAVIHSSHRQEQRGNERITKPREQGDTEIADLEKERDSKTEAGENMSSKIQAAIK